MLRTVQTPDPRNGQLTQVPRLGRTTRTGNSTDLEPDSTRSQRIDTHCLYRPHRLHRDRNPRSMQIHGRGHPGHPAGLGAVYEHHDRSEHRNGK
jgi:hypothetical protein